MKTDLLLHRLIVKFPEELLDSTDEAGSAKGKNKITGTLEAIIPIFVSLPFEIFKQAFQAKSFPIHDDIDRVSPLVSLVPSLIHQDTLAGTDHDTLADQSRRPVCARKEDRSSEKETSHRSRRRSRRRTRRPRLRFSTRNV